MKMSISSGNPEENLCRLCSVHCTPHFSLFENNAAQMLDSLTSIKIETDDPFTTRICLDCFSDLKNAYRIQQKIIENQKKFRETVNLSKLCVKEEVIDDVCEETSYQETILNSLDVTENEVKMEIEKSEEHFDSPCSESDNSNLIAETDYGLVEEDDLEIEEAYGTGCPSLIPIKSKRRYEKVYESFKNWLCEKKLVITDKTLVAYFVQRSLRLKSPGSLWVEYSMLKSTLNLNDGIDISQFKKLLAFLKKKNVGHRPKKSKVFTREQLNKFLLEAPDEMYIMMKVVMIMRVAGGLGRDELTRLTIDDITDHGSVVIVNVPDTKTHISRTFTITDKPNEKVSCLNIFRKYVQLRPKETNFRRFFYSVRQGTCVSQLVVKNTIGRIPQKVAEYLKLQDPKSYTGHAFRRTSATLLATTVATL